MFFFMSFGPTLSIMDNDNKKRKDTFIVNYESGENKDESKVETNSKNLVEGEDFKKLQKNAIKSRFKPLDYSKRKNSKYFVTLESGKKVHFGLPKYEDY